MGGNTGEIQAVVQMSGGGEPVVRVFVSERIEWIAVSGKERQSHLSIP